MAHSKHILILCSRLDLPGGIERAVVNTANLLATKGHRVSLLILDQTAESFYQINPGIDQQQIPLFFGITEKGNTLTRKLDFYKDIQHLKKAILNIRPDVILSSEYPFTVATILAGGMKYAKVYAWEHHHFHWLKKSWFWKKFYHYALSKTTGIICLNEQEAGYYKKYSPVTIIPNHTDNESGRVADLSQKQLLTVGRLIHRKGIDLLLPIAKQILKNNPAWTWKIIGDGEIEKQVNDFIGQEQLSNRLLLIPPMSQNLADEFCGASMYIMTSRFEAFPMVLLEAMSYGLPCISFDCPSGPSSIITHLQNGLLVAPEDSSSMKDAIQDLIDDGNKRAAMSNQALIKARQYSGASVYRYWEELILNDRTGR